MRHDEFDKMVHGRLQACIKVLSSKDKEYSSDSDRLHNFKRAAAMLDCSPEKALEGMWVKHLVSVQDLINLPDNTTPELIHEKIGDTINYALLLEGLLTERIKNDVDK